MASFNIYALTNPTTRGTHKHLYAMDKALLVIEVTVHSHLAEKLQQGNYYLLTNYTINRANEVQYLRLTEKSKIYKTGNTFEVPASKVEEFLHPIERSVPEALASPAKRRLSIAATVTEVYPTQDGPSGSWRRTDVVLSDEPTAKRIRCKLWNESSDIITPEHKGQRVTLTNVQVEIYKTQTQLKSTDLTTVSVQAPNMEPETNSHNIIGVDNDETHVYLISEDENTFTCSTDLFLEMDYTIAEFTNLLPMTCNITSENATVTAIDIEL